MTVTYGSARVFAGPHVGLKNEEIGLWDFKGAKPRLKTIPTSGASKCREDIVVYWTAAHQIC